MKLRATIPADGLFSFCIAVYYAFTYIASDIARGTGLGAYLLIGTVGLIVLAKVYCYGGCLSGADLCSYDIYLVVFAVFCLASSMWAEKPGYAVSRGMDILEVALAMYCIRRCLPEDGWCDILLKAWMYGGFIVVFYVMLRYGLGYWIGALSGGVRIDNSVINANRLGMTAAYSILIAVYYFLGRGFHWGILFSVPAFLVLLVSQSRKAIILLVIGVVGLMAMKGNERLFEDKEDWQNVVRSFVRAIFVVAIASFVVYLLSKLPMFDAIGERIQGMVSGLLGGKNVDGSTSIRMKMIEIGMKLFKEKPLLGVGIDNGKIYTWSYFKVKDYYLHNNYIELLADGGILGTVIYYSIYVALFCRLWRYRDFSSGEFCLVLLLLGLSLIMDYGMVTYDGKNTYFCLLVYYLEAEAIQRDNMCQEDGTDIFETEIKRLGS